MERRLCDLFSAQAAEPIKFLLCGGDKRAIGMLCAEVDGHSIAPDETLCSLARRGQQRDREMKRESSPTRRQRADDRIGSADSVAKSSSADRNPDCAQ